MVEELKTGVLICNILKFHQPSLDFTGINLKAKAKKQCLNNIEMALSILYQKGAASRYIPSAEEIYEGDKNSEKVWLLLKQIFDVFAMHDVILLMPKIVKWINQSLAYFPRVEKIVGKTDEIYQQFKTGIPLACILYLYVPNDEYKPDFRMMYEYPQNRKEYLENLSYIFNIAEKHDIPMYLVPQEYLDQHQPNFLLMQLYYLFCKYRQSTYLGSTNLINNQNLQPEDIIQNIVFKDEGRTIESQNRRFTEVSDIPSQSMDIIDEVDSVEFSSTLKSQTPTSRRSRYTEQKSQSQQIQSQQQQLLQRNNGSKKQQFLNPINNDNIVNMKQVSRFSQQQNQNIISPTTSANMNDEDANVIDEEEDLQQENHSEYHAMKKNISQASQPVMSRPNSRPSYTNNPMLENESPVYRASQQSRDGMLRNQNVPHFQVVSTGENEGIFGQTLGRNLQNEQENIVNHQPNPLNERKNLFFEDLRGQLELVKDKQNITLNENQIVQMYFSGNNANQTAHFINNFSYLNQESITQRPQINQLVDNKQKSGVFQNQNSLYKICDENGDLDDFKCLSLLFIPQIANIQINNQQNEKSIMFLQTNNSFHLEMVESYNIKVISYKNKQILIDQNLAKIESIVMKNMFQKQFLIKTDKNAFSVEMLNTDFIDIYFQALSFIYQKYGNKRF